MQKYYLYRHVRLDTNEVFYVGIGTKTSKPCVADLSYYNRAYNLKSRSNFWKKITAKTEYEVEIMLESDDYDYIKEREIEFIALYGRRNLGTGTLVNLTDGGEGCTGYKRTQESIEKQKATITGRKLPKETVEKLRVSMNKRWESEEYRAKHLETIPRGENHPYARLVLHTQTGVYYGTITEAAEAYGYSLPTLSGILTGNQYNNSDLIYAESEEDSCYPILPLKIPDISKVIYDPNRKEVITGDKGKPILGEHGSAKKVINILTGEIYDCAKDVTNKFGYIYSSFCAKLNPNDKRRNNTLFKYI